jgi:hypothetical protein
MEEDNMNYSVRTRRIWAAIVAVAFLFAMTTTAQAAVKKPNLNSLLASSGISFKLVKLDRTDGFLFGLSFKGKRTPSITISPGLGRMLLVQVGDNEMIFQGNGAGKMQVIQADGDIGVAMCILSAVIDFLSGLQTAQADPIALFTQIIALVTSITACSSGVTPTT